ncbi:MAG: 1-acyl-sn-glycerol-3-phosphate acyltransferase [Coprobacter sp.]|nr:1-acyl-sn-glycerol-3-phosphate acyltransferase [Coprobacter sp.]
MKQTFDFEEIRPYEGNEVAEAAQRLCKEELLRKAAAHVVPDVEAAMSVLASCRTVQDFQMQLALPILTGLLQKTSAGISASRFDVLSKSACYTYVSNHRDITLDSAFLNVVLHHSGLDTCEIAIGDNLLIYPWIIDFVRLNKSFIVKRGVSRRQMLEVSARLSAYMHYAVTTKKQSVWIAQREGRAKDSDDRTQESLIKMFALGGEADFITNIRNLNIAPVAISYEYDPCDYLKAKEMQQKRDNADYKKQPADDLLNMATGITGYKGRIHFEVATPINGALAQIAPETPRTELAGLVAQIIDKGIHAHYRLYPGNYVAYDALWGGDAMAQYYTPAEKSAFDAYVQQRIDKVDLPDKDETFLRERILEMYANPVRNHLVATQE